MLGLLTGHYRRHYDAMTSFDDVRDDGSRCHIPRTVPRVFEIATACMLIIIWEFNAIWTSSTRASRPRRRQIPTQIRATFPASVSRRAAGRLLEGNEERNERAAVQLVCKADYWASSSSPRGVDSLFMTSVLKTSRRRWRDLWHFPRRRTS